MYRQQIDQCWHKDKPDLMYFSNYFYFSTTIKEKWIVVKNMRNNLNWRAKSCKVMNMKYKPSEFFFMSTETWAFINWQ